MNESFAFSLWRTERTCATSFWGLRISGPNASTPRGIRVHGASNDRDDDIEFLVFRICFPYKLTNRVLSSYATVPSMAEMDFLITNSKVYGKGFRK